MIEFLFEVGMLKQTPRTGYQFLGSGEESVAEHSFRTAVIGYTLATMEPAADRIRVILMCLFHDLHEARTGDHNYVNKRYVAVDEKKAASHMTRGLPFGREMSDLLDEFNTNDSLEARLARDADQLDLIFELKQQLDTGNPQARDWLFFALKRLDTGFAKQMAQKMLSTNATDWWFDKDADWWINGPGPEKPSGQDQ
jgi:putative hydrolase of HD superfamily